MPAKEILRLKKYVSEILTVLSANYEKVYGVPWNV